MGAVVGSVSILVTGEFLITPSGDGDVAPPSLYLGQVATRARIPQAVSGANSQMNSASAHIARDDITAIQVGFVNWYQPVGSSGETDGGTLDTFTASVEYPLGTFTQLQFSGAANGGLAVDARLISC